MANNILFPPQVIEYAKLQNQFRQGFNVRKIFFQCELRGIQNDDAIFGVIAYPAWKRGNSARERWTIGEKVSGITVRPAGQNETFPVDSGDPLDPFTAFANNEIFIPHPLAPKSGEKPAFEIEQKEFIEALKIILEDEELLKKATLEFKAKISKNPHAEYDITLSSPTGSTTTSTNPSPPADPYE